MGLTFCILFTFLQTFFVIGRVLARVFFKNPGKVALVGETG